MKPLVIGIVEDDLLIAESISYTLHQLGYQPTEAARTYLEAVHMIEADRPDLLLVDIMIQGDRDGIELAATVRDKYKIPFIFLTANSDKVTVERAKAVQPSAYLVKPFNEQDLFTSIEIALANANSNMKNIKTSSVTKEDYLFVKDGDLFVKLNVNDILYVQSDNVYLKLFTPSRHYIVRNKLERFLEELGPGKFSRVHRSYAVNLDLVDSISEGFVNTAGLQVPLQRNYRDALLQAVRLFK